MTERVVAFAPARRRCFLMRNVQESEVVSATRRLDEIATLIDRPLPSSGPRSVAGSSTHSNLSPEVFHRMVGTAKEHIEAGDIFQVVLSQCFSRESQAEPFDVYCF